MKKLNFEIKDYDGRDEYPIVTNTGVRLGVIQKEVDGCFYYWPDESLSGCWPSYALRIMADLVDYYNACEKEGVLYE